MSASRLAILIPVLGRPHRVAPTLESIRKATPAARVEFIMSPGDRDEERALDEAVREFGESMVDYTTCDGNYAAKINHGVRMVVPVPDYYLFGADDLEFHAGWYGAALEHMRGPVRVVATNDLFNNYVLEGRLATHPLVAADYATGPTWDGSRGPLHEAYPHEYVDREFSEIASLRGVFDYAPTSIVEHLHPNAGKAPSDELYEAQGARMKAGRRVYRRRRAGWTLRSL